MQKTINIHQKTIGKTEKPTSTMQPCFPVNNKVFRILFVYNNEDDLVEVEESAVIDFNRVIEHLGEGNSVFIAPKSYGTFKLKKHPTTQSQYVNHI